MRADYGGPMPTTEMFQAIWQDQDLFTRLNIRHVKGVFLYFTVCDETGREVVPVDGFGDPIDVLKSPGPYRSAADEYDQVQELESKSVKRPSPPPKAMHFTPI